MMFFSVSGIPAPKGSNRAILRGGRAVMVPGSSNTNRDKQRAFAQAIAAACEGCTPIDGPVWVELTFYMPRPAGHYGANGLKPGAPEYPAVKPDGDKLARHVLDVLSGRAFVDDARVVELTVAKRYADSEGPGVDIKVGQMEAA